jgi:hypothetical protein
LTLDDDGVEHLTGNAGILTGSKYLNRVRLRIVLFLFKQQSKQNSNENGANNQTTNNNEY